MIVLKLSKFFNRYKKKKKIGLALSGGASRGLAHIGVLHAFEEFGYPIHAISGVSAGSLVGGLYASGVSLSTLIDALPSLNWRSFTSFHLSKKGMVSSVKIQQFVEQYVGQLKIKDCQIPFLSVATNLMTSKSQVFKESDHLISEVIRASCTFPGVFSPIKIDDSYYVDGGIFQHLPVKPLIDYGCDFIIGIDVIPDCVLDTIPKNIPLILDRSLDLMLQSQVDHSIHQPDILLRPVNLPFSSFDIKDYHQLIDLGYQSVKNSQNKLEAIF